MTNKTISTTVHGYKFAASGVALTITSTGKVTGSSSAGDAAIYGAAARTGESILNLGAVSGGSYLYGIVLDGGGSVTNGNATHKTAAISSTGTAIRVTSHAGTVTNSGSITGDLDNGKGVRLDAGGVITNGSATDTTARVSAYVAVDMYGVGKVTNFGTLKGQVNLYGGGVVTNAATGVIVSREAMYFGGAASTLTNLGTITGQVKFGSGQVVNGSKTDHTAFIGAGGGNYGIYVGTGTLTNFGTISGTEDAVAMQDKTVLIAEAGSKLLGGSSYGQGATFVFGAAGGAGTISGLGTSITGSTTAKFRDLSKYGVQAGASWTFSGTNTLKAADSLVVDGTLSLASSLLGSGKLSVAKGGTIKSAASVKGVVQIQSAVANAGLLIAAGGTLELDKGVTGAGSARISTGTLFAAGAFSEAVQFTGTTGTLELAHGQTFTGKITGFAKTGAESLDLKDIAFGAKTKATFTGTAAGGTLTVTDGTHTAKIALLGNYVGNTFKAATDGSGGTKIVDQTTKAATSQFVSAMAGMGDVGGGSMSPRHEAAPTTTLLAHPRE